MRRVVAAAVAAVAVVIGSGGPAQATEWSPLTQPDLGDWCGPLNAPDFDVDAYGHRWDVTLPASGEVVEISPAVVVPISYSSSLNDAPEVVAAQRVADSRYQALMALMLMHRACTKGGQEAAEGCISLGQVVRAMDKLTDNGNNDWTYPAPVGRSGELLELRHFWWQPGDAPRHDFRRVAARKGFDVAIRRRWATYNTPGPVVYCPECRESSKVVDHKRIYHQGFTSDYDAWGTAAVEAALAEVLAGPREGEYGLDAEGRMFVPYCQQVVVD